MKIMHQTRTRYNVIYLEFIITSCNFTSQKAFDMDDDDTRDQISKMTWTLRIHLNHHEIFSE
jgi:hypothetical protein